jgi:hypothetical protein
MIERCRICIGESLVRGSATSRVLRASDKDWAPIVATTLKARPNASQASRPLTITAFPPAPASNAALRSTWHPDHVVSGLPDYTESTETRDGDAVDRI